MEAERDASEETDLGVGGLDQSLVEPMLEGGLDLLAISEDSSAELDEGRQCDNAEPS